MECLSQKEAKKKLKEYGYNEIRELFHVSPLQILLRQIKKNFVVYLLSAAMLISFFVGKYITGYTILVVIFVVIFVGFIHEYKAEKSINALKEMIVPFSVVIRDNIEQEIPSKEIVPGDIIILTGESKEIKKFAVKNIKTYKKDNLIFMGTFVISGKCTARVLHTGMNTEFGKIAGMISTAEKELPLQV